MISYNPPEPSVVSIGEHIEGLGTVIAPDDVTMQLVEDIGRQTGLIDEAFRDVTALIAYGYRANLPDSLIRGPMNNER